jgi:hypothetical protein
MHLVWRFKPQQKYPTNKRPGTSSLAYLNRHTVEFSNNTRTPITYREKRNDQKGVCLVSCFGWIRHSLLGRPQRVSLGRRTESLRRNTLSGPYRDVNSLGPARCQPLNLNRGLAVHVVRVRLATSEPVRRALRREKS